MSQGGPRILFATGALYVYPLRAAFDLARAAGCDGVELDVCPESILRGPGAIARLAAGAGCPVRAVHPPLFALPGWRREDEYLPRLVELALTVQAPIIVLHPPKARHADGPLAARFVAGLEEAARHLKGTGTRIVLENPGFFRAHDLGFPFWQLSGLRRLAEQCGLPMALDSAHAGSSPLPLMESYALVRDRLAHVHLSDMRVPPPHLDHPWLYSYLKHHQLPGTGHLPLAEFLRALAAAGYAGDIALELSPVSLRIWSLRWAHRLLAQAVEETRGLLLH